MTVGHPGTVEGAWAGNQATWVQIPILHLTCQETLGKAWPFCEPQFLHLSNGTPHFSPSHHGELWEGMRVDVN